MEFKQKNDQFDTVVEILNEKIRTAVNKLSPQIKVSIQEIRIRVNESILLISDKCTYFLEYDGSVSLNKTSFLVNYSDIEEIIKIACRYSIYSYQNQIKNGFITLNGGHRIGLCGTAVLNENDITNIRDISSINIRVAKEIKGCAEKILKKIGTSPQGTLIVGPPSSGKTTILRDIARQLSSINNISLKRVSIVDERGEIAAVHKGIPQFDIGMCDVLNGYPKGIGILYAIRCLSPEVVICDEIGRTSEISAIEESLNAGVQIIASVHCGNIKELFKRKQINTLLASGAFYNIILLNTQTKFTGYFDFFKVSDLHAEDTGNIDFNINRNHGRLPCIV